MIHHLIHLALITVTISGERYSSHSFLHRPVTALLLCSNFFLSILFLNTLNLCVTPKVGNNVWHLYKTRDKVIVLYTLFFMLLANSCEGRSFRTEWQQVFPEFNLLITPKCSIQGLLMARWPQVALPRRDSQEFALRLFGLQQLRVIS